MRKSIVMMTLAVALVSGVAAVDGMNNSWDFIYNDPLTSLLAGTDGAQRVEYMTILSDVDGDGADEIAVSPRLGGTSPQGARIEIYEATADDTYAMTWSYDGASAIFYRSNVVTSADLDGNGAPEILYGLNAQTDDILAVFENTGDNTFATPDIYKYSNFGTATANMDFASVIAAGDIDGDGTDELVLCSTNPQDSIVIVSVASGTFAADNVVWTLEFERNWESADKGSPYAIAVGNIDNDANTDIAVVCWDNLRVDLYESTAANTYALVSSANIAATDDYSWYAAEITDLDGDGSGELWVLNIVNGNLYGAEISDLATVTAGSFSVVLDKTAFFGIGATADGQFAMDFGNQDAGASATDGADLYFVGNADGVVFDAEYEGGDPLSASSWSLYAIGSPYFNTGTDTLWMIEAPENDLDGDALPELVFTRQDADGTRTGGVAADTTLFILEWEDIIITNVDNFSLYE